MLLLVWLIYFITDVYGHVALKLASGANNSWSILFSFWGITAGLSWLLSVLSWTFILSKHPLLAANTVSSLTYILIALAAAIIFREPLTKQNLIGVVCVFIGIYLVTR
jgi:drug/metabolite transporter (DMT)-like permease